MQNTVQRALSPICRTRPRHPLRLPLRSTRLQALFTWYHTPYSAPGSDLSRSATLRSAPSPPSQPSRRPYLPTGQETCPKFLASTSSCTIIYLICSSPTFACAWLPILVSGVTLISFCTTTAGAAGPTRTCSGETFSFAISLVSLHLLEHRTTRPSSTTRSSPSRSHTATTPGFALRTLGSSLPRTPKKRWTKRPRDQCSRPCKA